MTPPDPLPDAVQVGGEVTTVAPGGGCMLSSFYATTATVEQAVEVIARRLGPPAGADAKWNSLVDEDGWRRGRFVEVWATGAVPAVPGRVDAAAVPGPARAIVWYSEGSMRIQPPDPAAAPPPPAGRGRWLLRR
jgi:hypothetical protein